MCESRINALPLYPFGSITESKIRWWGLCVNPEEMLSPTPLGQITLTTQELIVELARSSLLRQRGSKNGGLRRIAAQPHADMRTLVREQS